MVILLSNNISLKEKKKPVYLITFNRGRCHKAHLILLSYEIHLMEYVETGESTAGAP